MDRDLVMSDALVPPCQSAASGFLDDRLLRVQPGESTHVVHAGEERDRGEHDFLAVLVTQQPGAAETGDLPEMTGDLGFVVALVVTGCRGGGPSSPYPRDHVLTFPRRGD